MSLAILNTNEIWFNIKNLLPEICKPWNPENPAYPGQCLPHFEFTWGALPNECDRPMVFARPNGTLERGHSTCHNHKTITFRVGLFEGTHTEENENLFWQFWSRLQTQLGSNGLAWEYEDPISLPSFIPDGGGGFLPREAGPFWSLASIGIASTRTYGETHYTIGEEGCQMRVAEMLVEWTVYISKQIIGKEHF